MPYSHTRPRSLRARSTIITFSAWSLRAAFQPRAVDGRALDRLGSSTERPSTRRKSSGRRRNDREIGSSASEGAERGVRRRVARVEGEIEADGIGRVECGQATRQVDLVALARVEQLEHGRERVTCATRSSDDVQVACSPWKRRQLGALRSPRGLRQHARLRAVADDLRPAPGRRTRRAS